MTQPVSPRALGFAPVGEWERNAACITAWPAHEYAWGAFLSEAQREFTAFCRALLSGPDNEALLLLVPDAAGEAQARAALSELAPRVRYLHMPYGDVWLRDTAPIFVRAGHELRCVRFRCNGWGGKYIYPGDAELAERLAAELSIPAFTFDAVLEGGAVELDGQGTCLTTESCLLNDNRGAAQDRARIERLLSDAFAVDKVLWLREGLLGDHTDGHIDNLARFIAPGVVMHMRPTPGDPNRDTLVAIERELSGMTDAQGRKLRLVSVPSPGAVIDDAGHPIAASYMNFYLANGTVIVPSFGSVADEAAAVAIAAAFPGRHVELCSARAILEGGGGTFHCMTRQRPEVLPCARSRSR
jgi:agmatine deiminase